MRQTNGGDGGGMDYGNTDTYGGGPAPMRPGGVNDGWGAAFDTVYTAPSTPSVAPAAVPPVNTNSTATGTAVVTAASATNPATPLTAAPLPANKMLLWLALAGGVYLLSRK